MQHPNRRLFLRAAGAAAVGAGFNSIAAMAGTPETVSGRGLVNAAVLNPADRVPLSFVIDDSTCLVNMGHFCTPQFAAAFPDREEYQRPWHEWPREIPDSFVREFGEWCAGAGVKGKYSIVPYPACVGWLDRELPGWSRSALQDSLSLVRELMLPNWDIHPEMITHTRVIDIRTGRPFPEVGPATIENSYPQQPKSADELAEYLAYALKILKNCGLPCEGVTTPGGFGNRVKSELSLAVQQAVTDVFAPEIPHYFKYVNMGDKSTEPTLEHVTGAGTDRLQLTVNVPAGTGDWFGGWQGVNASQASRYCNDDATEGRMVELIMKKQPGVMLCHWPGMYCNGSKAGFHDFQRIVMALHRRFGDQTRWMKMSEIARYWAARRLTQIETTLDGISLQAPFGTPSFTLRISGAAYSPPAVRYEQKSMPLREVSEKPSLSDATWYRDGNDTLVCFELQRGKTDVLFDKA